MKFAGIIAEYDPFHNGHAWQLAQARALGAQRVAVATEKEFRGGRMSFSSEVKEELSRHLPTARHCQIAETAAILSLF